jgi:redox-sensitive bicupin YhaK (pirin superfamily)
MDIAKMKNNFLQLVSPNQNDEGTWIHQNAWIHITEMDENTQLNYTLKDPSNGVYFMLVNGEIKINAQQLNQRDALGVWNTTTVPITTKTKSKIIAIEVPMQFDY